MVAVALLPAVGLITQVVGLESPRTSQPGKIRLPLAMFSNAISSCR
jgi:hypothetical protein